MAADEGIGLEVERAGPRVIVRPRGAWTVHSVGAVDDALRAVAAEAEPQRITIDFSALGRIDTAGAYALARVLEGSPDPGADIHYTGAHPSARRLMALVRANAGHSPPMPNRGPGFAALLNRAGRGLFAAWGDFIASVAFFGELLAALARVAADPRKLRWAPVFAVMESAGVNALPIVGVLSFFVGAVMAYLGAKLLQQFGASAFGVELVAVTVLREFGVIITAIMLAGRSDSAFTAQIGAMRMQQEIDAMRVLGIEPFEALVAPRVIAMVIMTPLLTFGAMVSGVFGGMIVLWTVLDISPGFFLARMYDNVDIDHFWVGMWKSPVFAVIIAIIGCRHGLLVEGDVESLGRHVTASVVQSIFMVIVVDAMFAIFYYNIGI